MQLDTSIIDPRFISITALVVAGFVGLIQLLTYLRGRRQNPKIRVRVSNDDGVIISKPHLLVVKLFIDNQSTLRNTLIHVDCFLRHHWLRKTQLRIGDLRVIFHSVQKAGKSTDISMRLATAPDVSLDATDWKLLLTQKGLLPKEGLWSMPFTITELNSILLFVAIASDYETVDDIGGFSIVFRDVTNKRHCCSVNLTDALSNYRTRRVLLALDLDK